MLILSLRIHHAERMEKKKSMFWCLLIPLVFWGNIALVILLLPPVSQEPENLQLETWSYYGSQAPPANQILKYRNEILFGILICAVVSEIFFFVLEKRRERKK